MCLHSLKLFLAVEIHRRKHQEDETNLWLSNQNISFDREIWMHYNYSQVDFDQWEGESLEIKKN